MRGGAAINHHSPMRPKHMNDARHLHNRQDLCTALLLHPKVHWYQVVRAIQCRKGMAQLIGLQRRKHIHGRCIRFETTPYRLQAPLYVVAHLLETRTIPRVGMRCTRRKPQGPLCSNPGDETGFPRPAPEIHRAALWQPPFIETSSGKSCLLSAHAIMSYTSPGIWPPATWPPPPILPGRARRFNPRYAATRASWSSRVPSAIASPTKRSASAKLRICPIGCRRSRYVSNSASSRASPSCESRVAIFNGEAALFL